MKKRCFTMKNKPGRKIMALGLLLCLVFQSCIDDKITDFTTKSEDEVTSFLEKDPDRYSEFLNLLRATGISDMLNARGNYTCFVPTNEAVKNYFSEKGLVLEQLEKEQLEEIVYFHIIRLDRPDDKPISTDLFPSGTIGYPNMLGKFIQINYDETGNIFVNETARILHSDQEVHNGIVHTIDRVLEPSKKRLPGLVEGREGFSLFATALKETGLIDSLEVSVNESYDRRVKDGLIPETILSKSTFNNQQNYANYGGTLKTPPRWNIGFTVLMESDATYEKAGIRTLEDLIRYADEHVTPRGTSDDIKNRFNSLNRFVAYHIIDREMDINDFIPEIWKDYYTKDASQLGVMTDYTETLDPYGLLEIQRDPQGPILNKRSDGSVVRILSMTDNKSENGLFHEIDRILVYDEGVESDVLNKRMRMDATSLLPEMQTNRLKGNAKYGDGLIFPEGYFKNIIQLAEATQLQYGGAMSSGWYDLHLDELLISGKYDLKLKLPPVPEGLYEIRLGYTANQKRGILQIYLDSEPLGIPLDMTKRASDPAIGYVEPGSDEADPDGLENDKMMRNRGYMKGPSTIVVSSNQIQLRKYDGSVRRILTTARLNRGEHWLRFKSVQETETPEFMFDFLELVPNSYWDKEGVD